MRRGRSGSIVKVEHVGDRTVEDALDQGAYVNINANWVNAKGEWNSSFKVDINTENYRRSMAHSCRPNLLRKNHN